MAFKNHKTCTVGVFNTENLIFCRILFSTTYEIDTTLHYTDLTLLIHTLIKFWVKEHRKLIIIKTTKLILMSVGYYCSVITFYFPLLPSICQLPSMEPHLVPGYFTTIYIYRASQILFAATDDCHSQPWPACQLVGHHTDAPKHSLRYIIQFPSRWSCISTYIYKAEMLAFTNCDYCQMLVL